MKSEHSMSPSVASFGLGDDCRIQPTDPIQGVVDEIKAIFWEADQAMRKFHFVSPYAEVLLGYPINQWLEEPDFWANHVHREDRDQTVKLFHQTIEEQQSGEFEFRMQKARGGASWIRNVVTVLVRDDRPTRLVGVMTDITAKKRADERRSEVESQVRQMQRMESMGVLAGNMAHDFNNILAAIIGWSEIGLTRTRPGDRITKCLEEIRSAAARANGISSKLQALSRPRIMKPQAVDLAGIVMEYSKALKNLLGESINLKIDLDSRLPDVEGDVEQIKQVLSNLCSNARDAMTQGGRLVVRTRLVELDEHLSKAYPWMRAGPYVVLSVSDDGIGMDESLQSRIFDPFFSTKNFEMFSGLGLSVVYGIVKQFKGLIRVQSKVGLGTTMSVYLAARRRRDSFDESRPAS